VTANGSRLMVERVDSISSRPWIFVTGHLDGGPLAVGDSVSIHDADQPVIRTVIRSIEIHNAPGKTTIMLDASLKPSVRAGAVIVRAE
jgi:translation elongation factor EF-Tu-like GTPase